MKLWIRSKDKKCLILAEKIEIIEYDEKTFAIEINNWTVGSYKTKERALEVLDEIENRIINIQIFNKDEEALKDNNPMYPYMECVYTMPEE